MKIFSILILFFIVSCANNNKQSANYKNIDIENKMTFNEEKFKNIIDKTIERKF